MVYDPAIGMGITAAGALSDGPAQVFIGFYLVHRLSFLLLNLYYMFLFPKFRFNFIVNILSILIPAAFWLAGFFIVPQNEPLAIAIWWGGVLSEIVMQVLSVFIVRYWDVWGCGRIFGWKLPEYRTALNIEHLTERGGLLIILALGEYAVAIVYSQIGADLDFYLMGKAILGLLIAMGLRWVYFDGLSKIEQHAVRRHAVAGVVWNVLHFPIAAFLILNGAISSALIASRDYGMTYNKYYPASTKNHSDGAARLLA